MTPQQKREIVVEYEQIKLIRKRARTEIAFCGKCGGEADFVRVTEAAALFEVEIDDIMALGHASGSHFRTNGDGEPQFCVAAMLNTMREKANGRRVGLIEAADRPVGTGNGSDRVLGGSNENLGSPNENMPSLTRRVISNGGKAAKK